MVEGPQDGVHKALDEKGFEEAKEDVVFLQEANDAHWYQARNTRHGIRGDVWDVEGGKEKGERGNDETGR